MSDFNPYLPPQSDPILETSGTDSAPLASRGQRFVAQLIDTVVVMVINLPILYLSGYFGRVVTYAQEGRQFIPESLLSR